MDQIGSLTFRNFRGWVPSAGLLYRKTLLADTHVPAQSVVRARLSSRLCPNFRFPVIPLSVWPVGDYHRQPNEGLG